MKNYRTLLLTVLVVGTVAARLGSAGEDASPSEFPWDKGADTIDVKSYPKEQQENYKVFAEKCAKCHTLARPINSPYALPAEWDAYVDKMQHKKRSGVDEDSAKKIKSFLIYDSAVRKQDIIARKAKDKKDSQRQDDGKMAQSGKGGKASSSDSAK